MIQLTKNDHHLVSPVVSTDHLDQKKEASQLIEFTSKAKADLSRLMDSQ